MSFNIAQYSKEDFNATYSPEDNKLRLYTDVRIDQSDWELMKQHGWKWAPKQELFVCYWSVAREDFCLAIAGDILPEEMTMVERAEAKADRLLILAKKRVADSLGYAAAANELSLRIDSNQPILGGHHSQRKAEKTQIAVERNIAKAEETASAVGYWVWRAQGVIGHADQKNSFRTTSSRIKTLLKDMRDKQKILNEAAHYLSIVERVDGCEDIEKRDRMITNLSGYYFFRATFEGVETDNTNDMLAAMKHLTTSIINSRVIARRIGHTLNRLAYEQGNLNLVTKYDGAFTAGIIQTFMRTHGADKPKAIKGEAGSWIVESSVCLPLHIGSGLALELDDQEWRDLMQSVGYEVPAKITVASKPPICNFKTRRQMIWHRYNTDYKLTQVSLTKEEHKKIGKDYTTTINSACGLFRMRVGYVSDKKGGFEWRTIFITDSKVHATPESMTA
ncbi:MAG: DUF3560 domain-containing protein [Colwellia sp.]|nr:DUF3560 domain-containing protein [Colwellia sp.]